MMERRVTEVISNLVVGKPTARYELKKPIPVGTIIGFNEAMCVEKVPDPESPLTYTRTFDPSGQGTLDPRCTDCQLLTDCVIVNKDLN